MIQEETPEPMDKVLIVTPKSRLKAVIQALHSLGAMHIVEQKKSGSIDIGSPLSGSDQLSSLLVRIRSLQQALGIKPPTVDLPSGKGNRKESYSLSELESFYGKLEKQLVEQQAKLASLRESATGLALELKDLKDFEALGITPASFSSYSSISWLVGLVKTTEGLSDALSNLSSDILFKTAHLEHPAMAVFFPKKLERNVSAALASFDFRPLTVPVLGKKQTLKGGIRETAAKLKQTQFEIKESSSTISRLAERCSTRITKDISLLEEDIEKGEAPLKFGRTDFAYMVAGWIPAGKSDNAAKEIKKAAAGKVFIQFSEAGHHDNVPIKLNNTGQSKPFEFFLDLYSLPSYGEKDPTRFISLLFPLLFGFMLGDVGYGLATLALAYYLKKKFGDQQLFGIIKHASIASIFFGILFGEYFGFEEIGRFEFWHILSRAHDLNELMIIAIAIGFVHLNIGLGIGFSNVLRHHGLKMAIFEKGSWWVLQLGAASIGLFIAKLLPTAGLYAGISLIIAFAVMIVKGEGIKGLVEMPAIFSNMLSYARLMAIGVSSVKLAVVINEQSLELFHSGIAGIIGGVFILITGHAINLGLGLLGSFLHSLRLHYVEFFGKFFTGGGMRYQPFGKKAGSD